MSAQPLQKIRWESWALTAEADRRFRKTVAAVALPVLALAILIGLWKLAAPTPPELQFNGQQFVKLLPEVKQPKAAPEVAKPEEAKPAKAKEKKPEPKPEAKKPEPKPLPPQPTAREVAAKALSPLNDALRDLRDQSLSAVTTQQSLTSTISSKGGLGGSVSADAIAASAAAGGGAVVGGGSVTGTGGTGLGNRTTGSVRSTIPNGGGPVAGNLKGPAARTPAEIQAVFERNQGPFYAIYNRAARENANISRGKLVVRIVIAPSGAVTACTLVSSSFGDAEFERKIVERVKLLNFGAKNVPEFTIDYPINFIPQ